MDNSKIYVYVYGSLRKGQYNAYILKNAKYIKTTRLNGWDMFTRGFFPFLVEGEGSVTVELYEISRGIFDQLDLLESYPHHYQRKIVSDDEGNQGWLYYYENFESEYYLQKAIQVECGDWIQFYSED